MARPRIAEQHRLTRQIAVRLTDAEYADLLKLASQAGLRPGQLARMLVRKRQHRIVIEAVTRFDPAYIAQIRAIGHNLNMLTKNAMIFKRASPKVEHLCEDIHRIILKAVNERVEE